MTPAELGARAYAHVAELVQGIGPRPAGSPAEEQARAYVEKTLAGFGCQVGRSPVPFAPAVRYFPLYPMAGLLVGVSSWLVEGVPWLALLLPFLGALLAEGTRWAVRRRPRTAVSENLVAYLGDESHGPTLILCAHLDSAPASGFRSQLGLDLQNRWTSIFQRVAFFLALVAVLSMIGFTIPTVLVRAIRVVGTLAGTWLFLSDSWRQLARPGAYSPGAVDNASGCGLLLALAEHFSAAPPEGFRLGFLFTGAEETGMHGARAFAEDANAGTTADVAVLNVDMVGAGDTLRVVTSDGVFGNRRTDPGLNRLLFAAAPQARGLKAVHRSGDFARFLEAGIPTASIEISGSPAMARTYHTVYDDLSLIDPAALALAGETVIRFVGSFESGLKNGEGF